MYRKNREGAITSSNCDKFYKDKILVANLLAKDNIIINKDIFLRKYPIKLYLMGAYDLKERDISVEKNLWKIKGIFIFKLRAKFKLWKKTYIYKMYSIKE